MLADLQDFHFSAEYWIFLKISWEQKDNIGKTYIIKVVSFTKNKKTRNVEFFSANMH